MRDAAPGLIRRRSSICLEATRQGCPCREIGSTRPFPTSHLGIQWLLSNRPGGYAIGAAVGMNTRRYHGLLVAAVAPPVRRVVVLSSMIEQLVIDEQTIELSTFRFADADLLHPVG